MPSNYSINTNKSALTALQNLNSTARDLSASQNRLSTGRKIDSAKDNPAIWNVAQNQASVSSALGAVKVSLDRAKSTVDVAMAAGANISDFLNQMREKALAAKETSLGTPSRKILNEDFKVLRDSIVNIVENSDFNGYNLIKKGALGFQALASADGKRSITVGAADLSLGGTNISFADTATFGTATQASGMLDQVVQSIGMVNQALAKMGAQANQIDYHNIFVGKLMDALDAGVSNLVDADLAKESARLQALQVKQQLGAQALGIANQSTTILQSLFK